MSAENQPHAKVGSGKTTLVMVGLVASFVAMAGVFWYTGQQTAYDNEYVAYAGEQQVLSQRIAKHALQVSTGMQSGFDELTVSRNRFRQTLGFEKNGNEETGLPPTGEAVAAELNQLDTAWNKFQESVEFVIGGTETVVATSTIGQTVNDVIPKLQAYDEEVVDILLENSATRDKVAVATRQLMLSQRIVNNMNNALNGHQVDLAIERFSEDVEEYGTVLEGMVQGNETARQVNNADVQAKLFETSMLFKTVADNIEELLDLSDGLQEIQTAAREIAAQSDTLFSSSQSLQNAYVAAADQRAIKPEMAYVFAGIAALLLLILSKQVFSDQEKRRQIVEQENSANQDAILRLLDEMGNLADGDLSTHATVTEDFTGAIADSVNFTIDALREMVTTINTTSGHVSSAARQTQETARHLTEASEHQTKEITTATNSINDMAQAIDNVSKDAAETASMARKSVDIAKNGGETVTRSIDGMDRIRETIQETSKRIKRLGESSQEIGDIVELINDIAEQTNILALNAAIQAAMAGEAGRGFAVVADEVQRLAERSGNATKQIEGLVKAIQADTSEAVISMEQSTAGVVNGARLAEDAGKALDDIMSVSENLAGQVQNISGSAQKQSSSATRVSETMHVIQEITTQTSEGTKEVDSAIGNLTSLASEMGQSVAGFKLPE